MITGESEAIEVSVVAMDSNSLEARNIIFNGSLVVDGGCFAMAIRTGDDTLIGTMSEISYEFLSICTERKYYNLNNQGGVDWRCWQEL
jgi:magnesium-transporting ATPase (P-type)